MPPRAPTHGSDPRLEPSSPRGRGAATNPPGRYERLVIEADGDHLDEARRDAACADEPDAGIAPTELYRDPTRAILAHNDSPDVGFDTSLNPYRGCEHGCSYCFARPTHEWLGLSAGLDFERKIFVKEDAPALLARELARPSWRPRTIAIAGVTDAYQPAERRLRITRGCLSVLAAHRNPVFVVTKSELVVRDADLLAELARENAAGVAISVTTLDGTLARRMEPRASRPERRLAAIRALADAGVPVSVLVAPIVPGLNDHEAPRILEAVRDAGARAASFVLLRLPHGLAALFEDWLARHYPERRAKVVHLVRETREGALYDARFGVRQRGTGRYAGQIAALFDLSCRRLGLARSLPALDASRFRVPGRAEQLSLLEE